jgi:2-dehydro-3-deoxygluconokinase
MVTATHHTPRILCFGELLLRLSPPDDWLEQQSMNVYVGGAELNVATALALWGLPSAYCTALPDNYLSQQIIRSLNQKNVNTSCIKFSGERIGTYYLPQGKDLKNAGVIYDRAYSSFWNLKPGDIDWKDRLQGVRWFHCSAITPALNANTAALLLEAVQEAKRQNISVSIDLNYRSKLWQWGVQPAEVMKEILAHCDVVMGNLWAVESLLGISSSVKESKGKSDEELIAAASASMLQLHKIYSSVQTMAYTFRLSDRYFAVLQHGSQQCISRQFQLHSIIDGVGSGDAFMAGLIYGLHQQRSAQNTIDFAAESAVSKLSIKGDATTATTSDIQKLISQHAATIPNN